MAAAAGGSDQFPDCPICGGFHSDSYDCRPPWLSEGRGKAERLRGCKTVRFPDSLFFRISGPYSLTAYGLTAFAKLRKKPFRHHHWEVEQQPGRFRVRHIRTGQVFFVELRIIDRRREIGPCSCPCSCGNRPAIFPDLQCHHQRAVAELKSRQRHGLLPFQPPERQGVDYQSEMAHFQSSLQRHTRFGFLDCPHCQRRITKEHLDPDRWPALAGRPTPGQQSAFSVREAEGGTP